MTLEEMTAQLKKLTVTALAALVAAAASVAKERRLAGPIRTDEADLLPPLERRGRFDEEDLLAILPTDVVERIMCAQGPEKVAVSLCHVAHPRARRSGASLRTLRVI